MSKELSLLEKLQAIKEAFLDQNVSIEYKGKKVDFFKDIENALKNYQELIEKPCVLVGRTNGYTQAVIDTICKNHKEVKITYLDDQKKIKAFEIVNNKDIDIWLLKNCDYDNYCRIRTKCLETNVGSMVDCDKPAIPLPTKEEYDLLKEELL